MTCTIPTAAALMASLLVAGCATSAPPAASAPVPTIAATASSSAAAPFDLDGTVILDGGEDGSGVHVDTVGNPPACSGDGAYADLSIGTIVNVYDAANGKQIALGILGEGFAASSSSHICQFGLRVNDVPPAQSYLLEIVGYGRQPLSAADARTHLTINIG